MTSPNVMQAIAARASANPAYTQPIRIHTPAPELSKFQRTCHWLAVFVWGMTAGAILQATLHSSSPPANPSPTAQKVSQ
ncbi:MAG TPA: hypothetical protein V6D34_04965 [Candidatus Sericytochromatia bacterium]|jgi:hypothetical protein